MVIKYIPLVGVYLFDTQERTAVCDALGHAGFRVGKNLMDLSLRSDLRFKLAAYDALILGANANDRPGASLCANIMKYLPAMRILVIAPSPDDVVRCLDAGAIDGMTRPLRLVELVARLRASLRHRASASKRVRKIGSYLFDIDQRQLIPPDGTKPLRLSPREVGVLKSLCDANGAQILPARLLKEVWRDNVDTKAHSVATVIHRLRSKIEPNAKHYRLLETCGRGYRLNPAPDRAW